MGWLTAGDDALAAESAALAREHADAVRAARKRARATEVMSCPARLERAASLSNSGRISGPQRHD